MPGAGKQSEDVQRQIQDLLEAGFDPTTIHRRLKVGRSSVYRMKRCLKQHGTTYVPTELNKKNGRPKVLAAEQELEVRDWLRDRKNRNRYLDDLVWLIHDRFGIVCSTTTMSKLKRKWLHVIESEETGQQIDEATRALLMQTHPDLPILHQGMPPPAQAMEQMLPPTLTMHSPRTTSEHDIVTNSRLSAPHTMLSSPPDSARPTQPDMVAPRSDSQDSHSRSSPIELSPGPRLHALPSQSDSHALTLLSQIDPQITTAPPPHDVSEYVEYETPSDAAKVESLPT